MSDSLSDRPPIDSFDGDCRWLSNFAPASVEYQRLTFPTVENAYQAAKCRSRALMEQFISIGPGSAKKLGKALPAADVRPDWDVVKFEIMESLLRQKFAIADLRDRLLATEDALLVEGNTWGDVIWGVCDGVGENHLGRLLMRVRADLR